jgi:hypothetical protein
MEIRQLEKIDAKEFSALIVDMYAHLENLEWFSPMPYDIESVETMIEKPRFYIVGAFENGELCEFGNHKELLKIENGIYKNMFEMQARYYV